MIRALALVSSALAIGILALPASAEIKERNFKVAFVQMKDHPQGLSL
jgi:hypothetical protein